MSAAHTLALELPLPWFVWRARISCLTHINSVLSLILAADHSDGRKCLLYSSLAATQNFGRDMLAHLCEQGVSVRTKCVESHTRVSLGGGVIGSSG